MEITIVTTEGEREEYKKTVDARCAFASNEITREQWESFPQKVWVDLVNPEGRQSPTFLVVDNQGGNCWVKELETLDGAMMWALGLKITTRDGGDFIERLSIGEENKT